MQPLITRRSIIAGASVASAVPLSACAAPLTAGGQLLPVNGDRQWLLSAGLNDAPAILILHGGPGGSEALLFRRFNRALEARFNVVYWDQRGAGRSFDADHPPGAMTVAQFLRDLDVVVDHVRGGRDRPLVLLGHSWGSALGALYTHAHPEKVTGFIGVSQVADQGAQEEASYDWALAEARRQRHQRAIADLEQIGRPPFDVPALLIKNRWVESFGGYFAPGFDKVGVLTGALFRGQTSLGEVRRIIAGNTFSLRALWPEVRTLDVPARAPVLERPVAFFLGKLDRQCPPEIAAEWFRRLRAPEKELVWFERSAHNAPFEEPAAFNAAVIRIVSAWVR